MPGTRTSHGYPVNACHALRILSEKLKSQMISLSPLELSKNPSMLLVLRTEWNWWIPGAVGAFILASILISGWPAGLLPNFHFPYVYDGDGLFHAWMSKRVMEGWLFQNARSGFPFGSSFLDYPGADAGSHLLHKVAGVLSGRFETVINLYFLLGFSAVFVASYSVLRVFGLSVVSSLAGALIYDFAPFHFLRLGHLFYTWYFVAPLFFYFAFVIYFERYPKPIWQDKARLFYLTICFISLASFGVYYALFGVIVLATAGVMVVIRNRSIASAQLAIICIIMVVAGVLINIGPNLANTRTEGKNPEVATRSTAEAEIYGLKFDQLVLPRPGHRIRRLAEVTNRYSSSHPLVNENSSASLGVIGTAGMIVLFLVILSSLIGNRSDDRLRLLASIFLVLFLFGTIGGFGAIFSMVVSPSIRGWNRISIFIAFGVTAAFFLALETQLRKYVASSKLNIALISAALCAVAVGMYDQTVPVCQSCINSTKSSYELDQDFVAAIERSVPEAAAIYQLPYMPFPETPPKHQLAAYDLAAGFIHSKKLQWNYAGMKGREGDLFYRALSDEPIEKQIDVIQRLGFAGIYIDRRGFEDKGQALIQKITEVLGASPTLQRGDGQTVFFRFNSISNVRLDGLSNMEIMQKAGYLVDKLGARYAASIAEGIDFKRKGWPQFVSDVTGLSGAESWGRWSDANIAPSVSIKFFQPLPRRFSLILIGQSFGPNANEDLIVKIGSQMHRVRLPSSVTEIRIPVDSGAETISRLEFIPPHPVSPAEIGVGGDSRRLGIGLMQLRVQE